MNKTDKKNASHEINELLAALGQKFMHLQKSASLSAQAATLSPIEEAGQRIRTERKAQNLTLTELSDLSGIAYVTLNKIEQGHPSARLDSLTSVANALGMKLWIG